MQTCRPHVFVKHKSCGQRMHSFGLKINYLNKCRLTFFFASPEPKLSGEWISFPCHFIKKNSGYPEVSVKELKREVFIFIIQ